MLWGTHYLRDTYICPGDQEGGQGTQRGLLTFSRLGALPGSNIKKKKITRHVKLRLNLRIYILSLNCISRVSLSFCHQHVGGRSTRHQRRLHLSSGGFPHMDASTGLLSSPQHHILLFSVAGLRVIVKGPVIQSYPRPWPL